MSKDPLTKAERKLSGKCPDCGADESPGPWHDEDCDNYGDYITDTFMVTAEAYKDIIENYHED